MSQRPNDPALHWELRKLLLELGDPGTGKNWLLNALRLDEHILPELTALVDYSEQQGDAAMAAEYRHQENKARSNNLSCESKRADRRALQPDDRISPRVPLVESPSP